MEGNTKRPLGLSKGRLRPLSRGNCLIQVKITVIKGKQLTKTNATDCLTQGWSLNTVPAMLKQYIFIYMNYVFGLKRVYGNR